MPLRHTQQFIYQLELLTCTFLCTTLCIVRAGLGYHYDAMCLLLQIVINEDKKNLHQILTQHSKTCNILLV